MEQIKATKLIEKTVLGEEADGAGKDEWVVMEWMPRGVIVGRRRLSVGRRVLMIWALGIDGRKGVGVGSGWC